MNGEHTFPGLKNYEVTYKIMHIYFGKYRKNIKKKEK